MTYIELINRFWNLHKELTIREGEAHLYFKLLDTCNSLRWKSFRQSNRYLCAELGISERKLIGARNRLKQFNLIDFKSGRKNDCTMYSIIGVTEKLHCQNYSESDSETDSETDSEKCKKTADINKKGDKDKNKEKEKKIRKKTLPLTTDVVGYGPRNVLDDYNLICTKLPKAKDLTEARRKAAGARIKEHGPEKVKEVLMIVSENKFLCGSNNSNWRANFDWIFKCSNFTKISEGYYSDRRPSVVDHKVSTLEILEETYNEIITDGDFTY